LERSPGSVSAISAASSSTGPWVNRAGEVAELPRLLGDRLGNFGIGVTQVGDVRAPDRIQVALATLVDEPAAFAPHDLGILVPELPVEDVAVGVVVGRHRRKAMVADTKGRASLPAHY